ncbi:MAG: RimK family protein [Candidatus Cyclobacteriaceae bacterium M3_2C_046]
MQKYIVVDNPKHWNLSIEGVEIISSREYLTNPKYADLRNIRIFNLCKQYRYQSKGYYVSLLAEARGHKAMPNIKTIQDLKAPAIVKIISDELDLLVQKTLKKIKSNEYVLSIYFGQNISKHYDALSNELYKLFQAPFLRAKFIYNKKWTIQNIKPIPFNEIPDYHFDFVEKVAKEFFNKKRYSSIKQNKFIYDLAILMNPEEKSPPSNKKAINKFVDVAESMGFSVELITKDDYNRIGEFDALFIRETTSVNHHTYRLASRAQSEGLVVIDDPESILRCTNKVYLAELLIKAKIPTPKTLITHSENKDQIANQLGFPCVLKMPDSSFSQGVVKVNSAEEFKSEVDKMLNASDLIIAQQYTPSEFDWRIGFIDKKPLYACKYYMAKDHWQIYNWMAETADIEGLFDTVSLEEVPKKVMDISSKAAQLIGNGLYGVDVKEINGQVMIIEVNDNPNLDDGIENQKSGDELYKIIIQTIKSRLENRIKVN